MLRIITRSLLVLALAATARAQINADLDAGKIEKIGKNETNEKFLGALLGGLLGGAAPAAGTATTAAPGGGLLGSNPLVPLLIGGALGSGATIIGQNVLGKPNNNCGGGGLNFGRRRRQAEDGATDENDPNNKFFFNSNNGCNNPCGRRRRQAEEEGVDKGEKVDTKFFGLFGGGGANTNCGPTGNFNQPQNNNQGFNQGFNGNNGGFNGNNGGFNNQGGFNNNGIGFVNNQGFNNNQIICSCSSISKIDNNGQEEAQCRKPDHTGRRWCYTTSNSRCGDAVQSKRNPHNPWSYAACSVATRGDANTSTSSTCACSDISKIENGVEEAQCKKADHTGKAWCYATEGSNCPDAHPSTKYPQNPWSYVACSG